MLETWIDLGRTLVDMDSSYSPLSPIALTSLTVVVFGALFPLLDCSLALDVFFGLVRRPSARPLFS